MQATVVLQDLPAYAANVVLEESGFQVEAELMLGGSDILPRQPAALLALIDFRRPPERARQRQRSAT